MKYIFDMGVTLRAGDREYFYGKLDEHFPGMKQRYIRSFGNAYELPSPRNRELMRLFHRICQDHGILHENHQIFRYMSQFEEHTGQMSFFDSE